MSSYIKKIKRKLALLLFESAIVKIIVFILPIVFILEVVIVGEKIGEKIGIKVGVVFGVVDTTLETFSHFGGGIMVVIGFYVAAWLIYYIWSRIEFFIFEEFILDDLNDENQ